MTAPRVKFALDDDGRHFTWEHECRSDTGRWWLAETGDDRGGMLPLGLCRECGVHGFITNGEWRGV